MSKLIDLLEKAGTQSVPILGFRPGTENNNKSDVVSIGQISEKKYFSKKVKNQPNVFLLSETASSNLSFKIPKNINLVIVDAETGLKPNIDTKKVIYESFKAEDNFIVGLENLSDKNRLGVYDSNNQGTVLKFY